MSRVYDSNGPDVKIRGTASHIADKYLTLSRDAHSSGDRVAAENYLQHAEHYLRIIAQAQAQMMVQQPQGEHQQSEHQYQGEHQHQGEHHQQGERHQPYQEDAEQPSVAARAAPGGDGEPAQAAPAAQGEPAQASQAAPGSQGAPAPRRPRRRRSNGPEGTRREGEVQPGAQGRAGPGNGARMNGPSEDGGPPADGQSDGEPAEPAAEQESELSS